MDHRVLFIATFVVVLNFACAGLQVGLLRRHRPWPKALGVAVFGWALLMSLLVGVSIFLPVSWEPVFRRWLYLPMSVGMIWNLLFIQIIFLVLVLVTLAVRLGGRAEKPEPEPALAGPGLSRRNFVYLLAYGAAPATALGMGVHGTLTNHELRVRPFDIPIAGLPPGLEGFTIAHVSDLHSGIFCGPGRLKIIRDATNDLKADLVAIPGDIINHSMAEFGSALAAIQGMRSRYGTYLSEGNHDLIPGPNYFTEACAKNHLRLLKNTGTVIPVGGRRLLLGGLPWFRSGFDGHTELVSRLYPERQAGDVRVLLAHHPHLFDIAESADLVLSGHTHGGQIMAGPVGLGPMFFKYWSGLYTRNGRVLVVSNGSGDWFPCRIGAPAEVGLLRLTRARTA